LPIRQQKPEQSHQVHDQEDTPYPCLGGRSQSGANLVQSVPVLALSELPFDRDTSPLILSLLPLDLADLFFVVGSRLLGPAKPLACKSDTVILQSSAIIPCAIDAIGINGFRVKPKASLIRLHLRNQISGFIESIPAQVIYKGQLAHHTHADL